MPVTIHETVPGLSNMDTTMMAATTGSPAGPAHIDIAAKFINPANPGEFVDNLTHELQHHIDFDGLANGADPAFRGIIAGAVLDSIYGPHLTAQTKLAVDRLQDIKRQLRAAGGGPEVLSTADENVKWQRYAQSGLEAHADLSSDRRRMTPVERRALPPWVMVGGMSRRSLAGYEAAAGAWMKAAGRELAPSKSRGFQNPKNLRAALAAQGKATAGVKD